VSGNVVDLVARLRPRTTGIEVREETGWTCVLLAPGIGADEVRRALAGSGLTVVPGEGCATIDRERPTKPAA
jgi:hypothetical protein